MPVTLHTSRGPSSSQVGSMCFRIALFELKSIAPRCASARAMCVQCGAMCFYIEPVQLTLRPRDVQCISGNLSQENPVLPNWASKYLRGVSKQTTLTHCKSYSAGIHRRLKVSQPEQNGKDIALIEQRLREAADRLKGADGVSSVDWWSPETGQPGILVELESGDVVLFHATDVVGAVSYLHLDERPAHSAGRDRAGQVPVPETATAEQIAGEIERLLQTWRRRRGQLQGGATEAPKVRIEVSGGVTYLTEKPQGVEVLIVDYDNDPPTREWHAADGVLEHDGCNCGE